MCPVKKCKKNPTSFKREPICLRTLITANTPKMYEVCATIAEMS